MEYPYPPTYRRYTCNIETHQIKCDKLNITGKIYGSGIVKTDIESDYIKIGGVLVRGGASVTSTSTFYLTSVDLPVLADVYWSAELTVFCSDDTSKVGTQKCLISKLGPTATPQITVLGKVTNLTTFNVVGASTTSLRIDLDTACNISWCFYSNK